MALIKKGIVTGKVTHAVNSELKCAVCGEKHQELTLIKQAWYCPEHKDVK